MTRDKETVLGLSLRSALGASIFVPWTELLSGRVLPWPGVFLTFMLLAVVGRQVGATSRIRGTRTIYVGSIVLGVLLSLALGLSFPFFLGTVLFSATVGWACANAAFEPIDPFRVHGAAISGIWSFICLGILMLLLHRPSTGTVSPYFLLFVLSTGCTLIFARASHLRDRSRAVGKGASSTFLNTGLRFLLLAFLPALALGILAAPTVVANFLEKILNAVFNFLFAHLAPILGGIIAFGQRLLGPLFQHLFKRLKHHHNPVHVRSFSFATAHALAPHSRSLLTALVIVIVLMALVSALALLGHLIQTPAAKHDIFEEERESFSGAPPSGPGLPGTLTAGWPYSRAESSLRRAIRSILREAKGEGRGPHAFETVREWQRRQGDSSHEERGLLSAYEAHRYGGVPDSPTLPVVDPPPTNGKPE